MTTAFDPATVGDIALNNRFVMSPMTRNRAYGPGTSPTAEMAEYYAQRAGAGLIITEGTQPSAVGQGYMNTPGHYSEGQIAGWRTVTDAVHARGGVIFAQLMHTGRIGHPSFLPPGLVPVGPSAVAPAGEVHTQAGPVPYVVPWELSEDEIIETVYDFAAAARNAIAAGFDGVELHGANGYLLHQFLSTNANLRTDRWGGSIEGRLRFVLRVVDAVAASIGADRVGLRVSPGNRYNDIREDDEKETYRALIRELAPRGLAYLHVMESGDRAFTTELRVAFGGTLILNPATPGGVTGVTELGLVEDGTADLLSFGAMFLANPDLPRRLAAGGPFNEPDRATFYGGDAHGYIDYPTLDAASV